MAALLELLGSPTRRSMLVAPIFVVGFLAAIASQLLSTEVVQEAIRRSVIQAPDLVERAWQLPVASTFNRTVAWQANGSRCGPASVANVNRSFGEKVQREDDVLADTGKCWSNCCILGLTL